MFKNNVHVVIMAGGVGSRFWPMSTTDTPKQFIDILGCGRTFIQMTYDRFKDLCSPENVWVVTSAAYAQIVERQLPEVPRGNILLEPCRRNTAPCIAYVSWRIKSKCPDANIVVAPSDHIILNTQHFQQVVASALSFTEESDSIVTLGMKPNRPETGYGYIQADLSYSSPRNKNIFRVDQFKEKPDLETAKRYIQNENFFWNSGLFIWSVSPPCRRCLKTCCLIMVPSTSRNSSTKSIPTARTSPWITPFWRRQTKSLSIPPISVGVMSAHGARCTN